MKNKYSLKNIIFVPALVRICYSVYLTKRESGENPEQTRYCKLFSITNYELIITNLFLKTDETNTFATEIVFNSWEGVSLIK
jgi:cytidylate kinase